MDDAKTLKRKAGLIQDTVRRQVTFRWHQPEGSYLEGILARGDRRLGRVLERAYRLGCRMDGWSEFFSLERWMQAFQEEGLDPNFYALRKRGAVAPCSALAAGSGGISRPEKARKAEPTPDCRRACYGCGIPKKGAGCHGAS